MDIKDARKITKPHTWDDEIQAIIERRARKDTYHELRLEAEGVIDGFDQGVRAAAKEAKENSESAKVFGDECDCEEYILKLIEGKEESCKHERTWFDRTISVNSDGTEDGMHTRCSDCGVNLDGEKTK